MDFSNWVAEQSETDARALARRAIAEVPELCVDPLADRIEHLWREGARREERAQLDRFVAAVAARVGVMEQPGIVAPKASNASLLFPSGTFALGDGTRVTWGRATVEQHEQRIALLRKLIAGLEQTIAMHEAAIRLLRATGARCLEEIEAMEAVAEAAA
jgi:hypothetical protein